MSHFITAFKKGKEGINFGITTGIPQLDTAIRGLQKKQVIGLAAAPKAGKTTLCDFAFILSPYLESIEKNTLDNIEWIYFSYEIDRVSKEFKFASFFMAYDYRVYTFMYKDKMYKMSSDYLQGKERYKNPDGSYEQVVISEEHEDMVKRIYKERIVPLFGEYDTEGNLVHRGKIIFFEERENPTGLYKYVLNHARLNGRFINQTYTTNEGEHAVTRSRISGYVPNNPDKLTIVITDHIRRLKRERGFTMKENIDKWLEYSTDIKNLCEYTFIHVAHSNRSLANPDRLKFAGEFIFPTGDDTKDSGNFAEECTILMTLFNPNDEKYNLTKHMGVELSQYPFYRSLHITESRFTDCPQHIQMNMLGGVNMFTPLNPILK